MRIQSSHNHADRGLDPYFTCPEAVYALLHVEDDHLPHRIWEPAAGDGAISRILRAHGHDVLSTDIADYGWEGCRSGVNYLNAAPVDGIEGIVTNPPFRRAVEFAKKALREVGYLALLLRTNFLESQERYPFFLEHPPARVWISSRRLPMMHRHGWAGKKAASNTCHSWFIWQSGRGGSELRWFDWQEFLPRVDGVHTHVRSDQLAA
jgi:hypothetical protein